jgi:hypothetical protein
MNEDELTTADYQRSMTSRRASHAITEAIDRAEKAEGDRDLYWAVVDAAQEIGDSNFRRLENSLRKGGWYEPADRIQEFRKALAALNEPEDAQ